MNCLDYSDSDEESEVHHIKPSDQAGPAVATFSPAIKRSLDQDDDGVSPVATLIQPVKKKKLLPKLTPAFQTAPIDDPTLHQGRIRARPWVQGEYPAHIYLELKLSKRLRDRLGDIIDRVQSWVDEVRPGPHSPDQDITTKLTVHPLFARNPAVTPKTANKETEATKPRSIASTPTLHVSLSHPLPLRAFQIPLLLDHMRRPTGIGGSLRVGLEGGFRAYTNGTQAEGDERTPDSEEGDDEDEAGSVELEAMSSAGKNVLEDLGRSGIGKKSRGFLALKVGVGHDKLVKVQTDTIDRFLKIHHLPRYHRSPEFHASFAWILLSESAGSPFDEALLRRLETEFGKSLREEMKSGWEVGDIKVRVGKVVHSFAFEV